LRISEALNSGASNIACSVSAMSPSLALNARLMRSTSAGGGWSATK
jgi:hypothetical protein